MTKVKMAEVAEACGTRFLTGSRELPLETAKSYARLWFDDMESELKHKLKLEHAAQELRYQFRDSLEALRGSVMGMLQAVTVAQPQPRIRDPYGGQYSGPGARDREREERWRQEQQGGGLPFGLDKLFGGGPDPRPYQQPEPPRAAAVLMVKTDTVYQQVLAACALLDKVLAAAEPRDEAPAVPWAQTDEFLTEAQKLFAARIQGNGQRALDELDLLEERLKARYGVEVISADEDTARSFTLYPNEVPGDGSFETKTPAISVHGRVMLRGEALGPVQNPPVMGSAERNATHSVQWAESAGEEGDRDGEGGQEGG
jgi:hypothetical protein